MVEFEQRYDPSYRIMEDYPVVEYALDGRKMRSVLVSGYWKSGNQPMIRRGGAIVVYVDPLSPHEVVARMAVGPVYLVGLAIGVVVAAIGASCTG